MGMGEYDHFQWYLMAEQEQDPLVLKDKWEIAAEAELNVAEVELSILAEGPGDSS
ncbi:hypothetical protein D9M68_1005180 [compost metagenome]